MANAVPISISLPEDVLANARETAAQRKGSLDEVVSLALQRERQRRESFAAMIREGNEWGRRMGIASEEDVERIANGEMGMDRLKRSA